MDIVCQAPWGIGHPHVASELLHIHYIGLTSAHHHVQPVKVDPKDPATPQSDLAEFRGDGKGFTHFVFVGSERPDPLDTEKLSANTIDFAIRSVRFLVALGQHQPVRFHAVQFAGISDDADARASRTTIGLEDQRPGVQQRRKLGGIGGHVGCGHGQPSVLQHPRHDDLVPHHRHNWVRVERHRSQRVQCSGHAQRKFGPRLENVQIVLDPHRGQVEHLLLRTNEVQLHPCRELLEGGRHDRIRPIKDHTDSQVASSHSCCSRLLQSCYNKYLEFLLRGNGVITVGQLAYSNWVNPPSFTGLFHPRTTIAALRLEGASIADGSTVPVLNWTAKALSKYQGKTGAPIRRRQNVCANWRAVYRPVARRDWLSSLRPRFSLSLERLVTTLTEEADLAGVDRSLGAVEIPEAAYPKPNLPRSTLLGGLLTYTDCQDEARRLRQGGTQCLEAPSAALLPGGPEDGLRCRISRLLTVHVPQELACGSKRDPISTRSGLRRIDGAAPWIRRNP